MILKLILFLSTTTVYVQMSEYDITQFSCEKLANPDDIIAVSFNVHELLKNFTISTNFKRKHAYDLILLAHQNSKQTQLTHPCIDHENYLTTVDNKLQECGGDDTKFKPLSDEIEKDIVGVLYYLHNRDSDCATFWKSFQNPIDCSAFGYSMRIRRTCSDLIAKIGRLQVKLYDAGENAECCFNNRVKWAEMDIEEIVKTKCLQIQYRSSKNIPSLLSFLVSSNKEFIFDQIQTICTQHTRPPILLQPLPMQALSSANNLFRAQHAASVSLIVRRHEKSRLRLRSPCPRFDLFVKRARLSLSDCGGGGAEPSDDLQRAVISVLFNLMGADNKKCGGPWDTVLRHPIDCGPFGFDGRIRESCYDLMAGIATLRRDLFGGGEGAECCFSSRVRAAELEIERLVYECNH